MGEGEGGVRGGKRKEESEGKGSEGREERGAARGESKG